MPIPWRAVNGPRLLAALVAYLCLISFASGQQAPLTIASSAFGQGEPIPWVYTCQGRDISPPLAWSGVPEHAKSLVLIVDDPDAPDPKAPRMRWVHWVLYNIPPAAAGLPEDIAPRSLPPETDQGLNDWKRTGYGGPCPPIGRHRYFFTLYALDTKLSGLTAPTRARIQAAMKGHVMEKAVLMGTYEKAR